MRKSIVLLFSLLFVSSAFAKTNHTTYEIIASNQGMKLDVIISEFQSFGQPNHNLYMEYPGLASIAFKKKYGEKHHRFYMGFIAYTSHHPHLMSSCRKIGFGDYGKLYVVGRHHMKTAWYYVTSHRTTHWKNNYVFKVTGSKKHGKYYVDCMRKNDI